MEAFEDRSTAGNELAFRKGKTVPEGDINLAYAKVPPMTPERNVVILDTSRIIEENVEATGMTRKLYYANALGILEDENGNQLVTDEYPIIADTFRVDEDFNPLPGSEYTAEDMLPYLHVSRYFHIDYVGQTMGTAAFKVDSRLGIRVVDSNGHEYTDENGKPRYVIKIAFSPFNRPSRSYDQAPYRVHAYVDTDTNEDLYLAYNKVELDENYLITNQEINWTERLNPVPYYEYQPEESMVVDPAHRANRWYSTKPLSYKENVLGVPRNNTQGYKAYVPRKAVADPRIFQLFRWRLKCTFTQPYKVDPNTRGQAIRCGVIVTNADPHSRAAYAFLNLQRSGYNATGVRFENPLSTVTATPSSDDYQEYAEYWHVNIDTISYSDLKRFDILIWSPSVSSFDFSPYVNKIDYFTNTVGGTLFIDTNSYTYATNAGATFSAAINPTTGQPRSTGTVPTNRSNITASVNPTSSLISGLSALGGWDIGSISSTPSQNDNQFNTLSYIQLLNSTYWYSQQITSLPTGWNWVWRSYPDSTYKYLLMHRTTQGGGNYILGSAGVLFTCSALFSYSSQSMVSDNLGTRAYQDDDSRLYINSTVVEGAMKLLFNACLMAVRGRLVDNDDEQAYSTTWSYATDWQSSWVINAANNVLSEAEKSRHSFVYGPKDVVTPTPVWQRRLSASTVQQLIDQALTEEQKRVVQGAVREYEIEVTNFNVQTPSIISDNTRPYVWTEVYSPPFTVPAELGPHIVKEEETKGDYEAGQYIKREYPDKPYSVQVQVTYVDTYEDTVPKDVTWTALGTAKETFEVTTTVPPSTSTTTSLIELNWQQHAYSASRIVPSVPPYNGTSKDDSIWMMQEFQYYNWAPGDSTHNWIHYGLYGQWGPGSSGEAVQYIQWALNRIQFFGEGRFYHGYLAEDGYYGSSTAAAVRNFQVAKGAKYIDSVVDAETLSLLGAELSGLGQLALIGTSEGDYTRWGINAVRLLQGRNINDGNVWTTYSKRSWVARGPQYIWDVFFVFYNRSYKMHGITVIPQADAGDMLINAFDMSNAYFYPVWQYDVFSAIVLGQHRVPSGQRFFMPMGPYMANAVAINLGQDRATWPTSARQFGVHDILPLAEVTTTTTIPGYTKIVKQTRTINVSDTGTAQVSHDRAKTFRVFPSSYTGTGQLSNLNWTSISTNNPNVNATITSDGLATLRIDSATTALNSNDPSNFTFGPAVPTTGATYYSMDENRRRNPMPESGWIKKNDGIKLLCKADLTPYGFTAINGSALLPTGVGANEMMRHYTKLRLLGYGNDPSIRYGFYDISRQEFVTNAIGEPEISFIEYQSRGPQNIYIGLVSNYEVATLTNLPSNDDAPLLPYRWAMPVYGVVTPNSPRITIEPIQKELGPFDVWPIAIKPGRFDRRIKLSTMIPMTGTLAKYQDQTVHAFYGVPEAQNQAWSELFGPPYVDVKGETPILEDIDIIRVRQAPFKMQKTWSVVASRNVDPQLPQFTVYTRPSTASSTWTALTLSDIRDWNASTGEIYLETPLAELDPDLVKVDYVTNQMSYHFKGFSSAILNLNPYPGATQNLIGVALYVYVLPEYVKDPSGSVISDTIRTSTINYTTNPNIFDVMRPEYDPLAVLLGVVYITPSVDVRELALFDTRRRGGGALNTALSDEVVRLTQEASNYWDISYGAGESYPKGGFVIIRLPSELKDYFSDTEIIQAIERNITAGVGFQIEDLEGNAW